MNKKMPNKSKQRQNNNNKSKPNNYNKSKLNNNDSDKDRNWSLNKQAKNVISKLEKKNINLSLSQNRYCYYEEKQKNGEKQVTLRPLLMDRLKDGSISSSTLNLQSLLNDLVKRNEALAASFPKQSRYDVSFPGRIMLGEGGSTPYSNIVLLKLHPLYGTPFVPASTIKGVLRSCWNALYTETEEAGADHKSTEDLLFGTAEAHQQEGKLICFDAFPKEFSLTLDVETPHYSQYYSNGAPPTDDQTPTPISIICMENVTLPIHLACRDEDLWERQKENLQNAVKMMIEVYGMGAKTALGYGIGKIV